MIDTLRLNITDCEITSHCPLTVEPSPYMHDNDQRTCDYDLFVNNAGEIVTGKKAYYNGEKFNITIKPKYSIKTDEVNDKLLLTGEYKLMQDKESMPGKSVNYISRFEQEQKIKVPEEKYNSGIYIQTSLPRYFKKTNFESLNKADEKKIIKQWEKDLAGIGIKTNLWDARLSRVDSFTNIFTDENFYCYTNLFDIMVNATMEQYRFGKEITTEEKSEEKKSEEKDKAISLNRFEYARTTYLWKNGERQICVYDKINEMKNKIKDATAYGFLPANVMRLESRYVRSRKVTNAYFKGGKKNLLMKELSPGIYKSPTVYDLYKHYDYVKENHKSEIETTIFKYDLPDIEKLTGNSIKDQLVRFKSIYKRRWLDRYFWWYGMASFLKLSDIDTLIEKIDEIIEESNDEYKNPRMIKSRIRKNLQKTQFAIESMKSPFESLKSNKELYEELKEKFYKAAA